MHTHLNILVVCTNYRIFYCTYRINEEHKYNSNNCTSLYFYEKAKKHQKVTYNTLFMLPSISFIYGSFTYEKTWPLMTLLIIPHNVIL